MRCYKNTIISKERGIEILEFLQIIKNLKSSCYGNRLQNAMNMDRRKVVLFYPYSDLEQMNGFTTFFESLQIPLDYICILKEKMAIENLPYREKYITMEDLEKISKQYNIIVFTREVDFISWKFQELFYALGINNIFPMGNPQMYKAIYEYIMDNIDKIYSTYSCLNADDDSREVYVASLYNKVSGVIKDLKFADSQQYFLNGYLPKQGDVVIDGGSYDGSNAKDFCQLGCDVYAFELDCVNYKKVQACADKYRFTSENRGLGAIKDTLSYSMGGAGSRVDKNGKDIAQIIDIDTYVIEKDMLKIDFIKMDIEGSELAALQGAKNSICKWKPKLAICMYHKLQDMWEIPLYIKSLRSDYEFSFRHYPIDSRFEYLFQEDDINLFKHYSLKGDYVKTFFETVLYCR